MKLIHLNLKRYTGGNNHTQQIDRTDVDRQIFVKPLSQPGKIVLIRHFLLHLTALAPPVGQELSRGYKPATLAVEFSKLKRTLPISAPRV